MSDKIKKRPDLNGYYWFRFEKDVWRIVEVYLINGVRCGYRSFDGTARFIDSDGEWIGPLTPENVEVFKTTTR